MRIRRENLRVKVGSFTSGEGGGLVILLKLEIMDVRVEERVFSFSLLPNFPSAMS